MTMLLPQIVHLPRTALLVTFLAFAIAVPVNEKHGITPRSIDATKHIVSIGTLFHLFPHFQRSSPPRGADQSRRQLTDARQRLLANVELPVML